MAMLLGSVWTIFWVGPSFLQVPHASVIARRGLLAATGALAVKAGIDISKPLLELQQTQPEQLLHQRGDDRIQELRAKDASGTRNADRIRGARSAYKRERRLNRSEEHTSELQSP